MSEPLPLQTPHCADYHGRVTESTDTPAADAPIDMGNGTLDPLPGHELPPITLDELLRGGRPMTVLERLEAHALGRETMEASEIQAAKIFLDKTVPTLKATEHTGEVKGTFKVVLDTNDATI